MAVSVLGRVFSCVSAGLSNKIKILQLLTPVKGRTRHGKRKGKRKKEEKKKVLLFSLCMNESSYFQFH